MPFLLLFLMIFSTPAFADFETGRKAFAAGDYERAFTEWQAAAEQGVASAQRNVGHLYRWGKGVSQDLTQGAPNLSMGHSKDAGNSRNWT